MEEFDNKDKFENAWKEALGQAESEPSEDVWSRIEASVATEESIKYRKRLSQFKFVAAASVSIAILFAGIGVYYSYRANDALRQLSERGAFSIQKESPTASLSIPDKHQADRIVSEKEPRSKDDRSSVDSHSDIASLEHGTVDNSLKNSSNDPKKVIRAEVPEFPILEKAEQLSLSSNTAQAGERPYKHQTEEHLSLSRDVYSSASPLIGNAENIPTDDVYERRLSSDFPIDKGVNFGQINRSGYEVVSSYGRSPFCGQLQPATTLVTFPVSNEYILQNKNIYGKRFSNSYGPSTNAGYPNNRPSLTDVQKGHNIAFSTGKPAQKDIRSEKGGIIYSDIKDKNIGITVIAEKQKPYQTTHNIDVLHEPLVEDKNEISLEQGDMGMASVRSSEKKREKNSWWIDVNFDRGTFNEDVNQAAILNSSEVNVAVARTFSKGLSNDASFANGTSVQGKFEGDDNSIGMSYTTGINVGRMISEKWGLQAGLQFARTESASISSFVQNYFIQEDQGPVLPLILDKNAEEETIDTREAGLIDHDTYDFNTISKSLSFPVQLNYILFEKEKIGIMLSSGVATDFLLNNEIREQSGALRELRLENLEDSHYKDIRFSALIGAELFYKFNSKYSLSIKPNHQYALQSVTHSSSGFISKPSATRVGVRFRYAL